MYLLRYHSDAERAGRGRVQCALGRGPLADVLLAVTMVFTHEGSADCGSLCFNCMSAFESPRFVSLSRASLVQAVLRCGFRTETMLDGMWKPGARQRTGGLAPAVNCLIQQWEAGLLSEGLVFTHTRHKPGQSQAPKGQLYLLMVSHAVWTDPDQRTPRREHWSGETALFYRPDPVWLTFHLGG